MDILSTLLGISFAFCLTAAIMCIIFGLVTMPRLRKNPETKDKLGVSFLSGWDTFNVAGAFYRPKWLDRKLKESSLPGLAADSHALYKHTTVFDRVLARMFWLPLCISVPSMLLLAILESLGIFT